ncbi:MAG: hypothetical protein ACYDBH_18370, partial [Acidobacteriaceae bacterium]
NTNAIRFMVRSSDLSSREGNATVTTSLYPVGCTIGKPTFNAGKMYNRIFHNMESNVSRIKINRDGEH